MSNIRTISLTEVLAMQCDTFSIKDNSSARGITTVNKSDIQVGDKIVLNNYFTLIVAD